MTSDTHAPSDASETKLKRHVGVVGLLFASVGSIIGSGWLFGANKAASEAGPAAIISWFLGGVLILLIALCYAELGTMFPLSGGVVRFPHMSFGNFASFSAGWITYVAVATTAPIEVLGALQYGTKYAKFTEFHPNVGTDGVYTLTTLGFIAAVILMAIFVVINYIGIRWFARINNVLVSWKIVIILLTIIAFLVTQFHGSNFTVHGFAPNGVHGVFTAIATSGIVFSYLGFRQGIELAGETDNPRRNVPIAVVGSVVLTGIIYIGLQVAFIGSLDPSKIASDWSDTGLGNEGFGPLAAIATTIGLGWLATLLYIDAVISPGDTGLIYTTVTSRISFAMSKNGNAPKTLAKTTKSGAPLIGLILAFVIGIIAFLPFPSWSQLVGFVSSATVLSFASGPLVHASLRRQLPDHERPFRLPGGHTIPFLAFFGSNLIVYWSGWDVVWKLMVAVLIGYVLLAVFYASGVLRGQSLDVKSGAWVIPWLAGLTILSYVGSYPDDPPAGNLDKLSFEGSIPLVLALSVIVYLMAYFMRLPDDQARAYIEETVDEARVEEQELGSAH